MRSSRETGEPDHGNSVNYQTVWYRWTAPGPGNVRLSATGPGNLRVVGYLGTVLTNLVRLGTVFPVSADDDVAIVVTGLNADACQLQLSFSTSPINDNFEFAAPVGIGTTVAFDTRGATIQAGETNHAGVSGAPFTVWFQWTAQVSGAVTMLASSTNADPLIAVYTGSVLTNLKIIATSNNYLASSTDAQVSFNAVAGQTYRIAVATRSIGGDVQLLVKQGSPPTVSLQSLPITTTNTVGGTYDFDISPSDPDGSIASVRFYWGNDSFLLTSSPYHLSLTNLVPGTYLVTAVATDNDGLMGGTPFVSYRVTPATDEATNRLALTLNVVTNVPFRGAAQQPGEPFAATWWSFTSPSNGTYLAYSSGTRLAVYEVNGTNLVNLGTRISSVPARLAFVGGTGRDYAIASGDSFNSVTVQLCITNGAPNDFFTNAMPLIGTTGLVTAPVFAATMEQGETNHTGTSMQSSTWWSWTAPGKGTLVLEPSAASSPAAVVYVGTTVSNIVPVGTLPRGRPSPWVAPVSGGVSYSIALACGGSSGFFTVSNAAALASLR